jgi:DNA modification methylase
MIAKSWIMHGDCLRLLRDVPDRSVDMILCDLPYGTTQSKWDCALDLEALWKQYRRVCTGAIVLTAQTPFDKVLGASNLEMLRYEWIWEKTEATGHMNAKKCPMKAHENVLVFYAQQPTYNPIKTPGHARKTATKRGDVSTVYGEQKFDAIPYDSTERYPRSVLTGPTDKQRLNLHPAQKPLWLMEYMVRTYTNEEDTVLDNCMGSGTTGVACANLGRKFIGMELDEAYAELGCKRVENAFHHKEGV